MSSTTSTWQVHTFRHIIDADGILKKEGFTEDVAPGHKLLEQSCSPSFVKGEPGRPQYFVGSVMTITTGDSTVMIKTPDAYTVPEYQIVNQASLAMHYEKRWVAKPRHLLRRYCGLKSIMWYDYLEDRAAEHLRNSSLKDRAAEYLRYDYLKGKAARYLRYDYLKGKTLEYFRRQPEHVSKILSKVMALLLLLLLTALIVTVNIEPDKRLEMSYQTHLDLVKMLNATRPIKTRSLEITHQANRARSVGLQIGHSQLLGKGEIVEQITTTSNTMLDTANKLQTYRHNVWTLAILVQEVHRLILSKMGPRAERSRFPWYIIDGLKLPSKSQLRRDWIANNRNLRDIILTLVDEADTIDAKLQSITEAMQEIECKMRESQKTQVDAVRGQENSWFHQVNIFAVPTSVYEDDLKLIDSFFPDVQAALKHVTELKSNLKSIHDNIVYLKDATFFDPSQDLLSNFGMQQQIVRESLEQLGAALQYEVDANPEPVAATDSFTSAKAALPTD